MLASNGRHRLATQINKLLLLRGAGNACYGHMGQLAAEKKLHLKAKFRSNESHVLSLK